VINSSLPTGLVLSSSGLLTGNPSVGGTYGFTVRATDSLGNTGDLVISNWVINWTTLSITTGTALPGGVTGTAYNTSLAALGGNGQYTWTLIGGTLPGGLNLSSGGVISGVPNTPANYSVTIQVASGDGQTASKTFSLAVTVPVGFKTVVSGVTASGVIVK
jgi:hypothetical protein